MWHANCMMTHFLFLLLNCRVERTSTLLASSKTAGTNVRVQTQREREPTQQEQNRNENAKRRNENKDHG